MELKALRYFVTVAEELHFGRAAERLHIVQPAVSQQVARLERELGVQLLERTSRRVRLTPAGLRVLAAARETLAAAARVRVVAGAGAARLRVGVESCVTDRLDRAVKRLREGDRPTEPVLIDLPMPARLDAVRGGDLDVALVRGTVTAPGLTVARAWSEPLHVVVAREHPVAGQEAVRFGDLDPDGLRLPGRHHDPGLLDAIMAALPATLPRRPAGDPVNVLFEVGSDPRTWTVLPAEHLAAARTARIRTLPLDPPAMIDGYVVTAPATPPPCVRSFVAAFADRPDPVAEAADGDPPGTTGPTSARRTGSGGDVARFGQARRRGNPGPSR
ncbi:DNA-binding transcriptional LysR family regulator [Catenuloplanes nepalensis]|uniref:DNA-binding transcriptional LysR family regulator n=1 Tax=Catenuloplanes nepalensis TaxID=587533 RepID=A0ABT9MSG0_9ACTN|nr:LysR family transcriptional regulator [Catenuloplanes nepalensis]MDP9793971.1 DNA-binding transcriptional LysR family regulator [Catenuloplanes nepalensis]